MSHSFFEVSTFMFVCLFSYYVYIRPTPKCKPACLFGLGQRDEAEEANWFTLGCWKVVFLFSRMRSWRKKAGFQFIVCYSLNHGQSGNLGTSGASASAREKECGASKNKQPINAAKFAEHGAAHNPKRQCLRFRAPV